MSKYTAKINLKVLNIHIKPLLKPKNRHKKLCFETAYLGENVKQCVSQKYPKVLPFLGHLIFEKNPNELSKVSQLVKITQSGHPALGTHTRLIYSDKAPCCLTKTAA